MISPLTKGGWPGPSTHVGIDSKGPKMTDEGANAATRGEINRDAHPP